MRGDKRLLHTRRGDVIRSLVGIAAEIGLRRLGVLQRRNKLLLRSALTGRRLNRLLNRLLNGRLNRRTYRRLSKPLRVLRVSVIVVAPGRIIVLRGIYGRLSAVALHRRLERLSVLLGRRLVKGSVLIYSRLLDRVKRLLRIFFRLIFGLLHQRFFRIELKRLLRLFGLFGKRTLRLIACVVFKIIVHSYHLEKIILI